MLIYTGYKNRKPIFSHDYCKKMLRLWGNERCEVKCYRGLDFSKSFIEIQKPRFIIGSSCYSGTFKKRGSEIFAPNYRVPDKEAETYITQIQENIKQLREELNAYIEANYMSWNLLSLAKAEELCLVPDRYRELKDKVFNQINGKDESVKKLKEGK